MFFLRTLNVNAIAVGGLRGYERHIAACDFGETGCLIGHLNQSTTYESALALQLHWLFEGTVANLPRYRISPAVYRILKTQRQHRS